ncbi:hypothetical protein EB796_000962 [Bugula neritina]|uniref:MADF domain-containing protein n=1 Tax=Bugula neritina TaxID=10212 RepID=A0A7J7KRF0_BUGNE|nr:hypothetical protein EB796_000962 [Bugula neritina]
MATQKINENYVINFIAEIESRPNIWNYKIKGSYKTKNKELAEVAKAFNVSSNQKWQNLRDYFKEILKRQKNSTPSSGASPQEVLEPTSVYWKNTKFLLFVETQICEESHSSLDETIALRSTSSINGDEQE